VPPRNLASDPIKGGAAPAQLYQRIAAGIPAGDGEWLMPQFGYLGPKKIWALIFFLEKEVLPPRQTANATAGR
jgi:hypothetical protein